MTKTTTEPVCMYFTFEKLTSIKDEDLEGADKINPPDMMTKVLYGKKKQDNVSRILYDIWDHKDGPETAKD